jgi:hypothetical protein
VGYRRERMKRSVQKFPATSKNSHVNDCERSGRGPSSD